MRKMVNECALEISNISKKYQDGSEERIVLDGASLSVKAGEFVAIVGPSGCGKSTFLSIAGLLLSPDSGEVKINGHIVSRKSEWTTLRRDHIGFIFQDHQLLPYLKAVEQITAFQTAQGKKVVQADKIMKELGVDHVAQQYPSKLSGGERQRVAIARAFANNPEIILADEPTAALDAERGSHVVSMISAAVKRYNKAALMVTHDTRVLHYADRVFALEDGKLKEVTETVE